MKALRTLRPGTTLIELLIFLAVLSVVITAAMPLLYGATENRLLQQTISIVEQNGTQILQNTALHIRQSERILAPAAGQTGSVLALQTASGGLNPTIIGVVSGSLVIIQHSTLELVSSPQVAITDLVVRNTSTSASRQSVLITFRVSRTIRLQQPHSYSQRFEEAVTLPPDDVPYVDDCSCVTPYCSGHNVYAWQICESNSCLSASTQMQCP